MSSAESPFGAANEADESSNGEALPPAQPDLVQQENAELRPSLLNGLVLPTSLTNTMVSNWSAVTASAETSLPGRSVNDYRRISLAGHGQTTAPGSYPWHTVSADRRPRPLLSSSGNQQLQTRVGLPLYSSSNTMSTMTDGRGDLHSQLQELLQTATGTPLPVILLNMTLPQHQQSSSSAWPFPVSTAHNQNEATHQQQQLLQQMIQSQIQILQQRQGLTRQQTSTVGIPTDGTLYGTASDRTTGGTGLPQPCEPAGRVLESSVSLSFAPATETRAASMPPGAVQKEGDSCSKPKRPLSAYNLFFMDERVKLLKEAEESAAGSDYAVQDSDEQSEYKGCEDDPHKAGPHGETRIDESGDVNGPTSSETKRLLRLRPRGKVGFEEMARIIGKRWKQLDPQGRLPYEQRAAVDKKRYQAQVWAYNEEKLISLEAMRQQQESTVAETTRE